MAVLSLVLLSGRRCGVGYHAAHGLDGRRLENSSARRVGDGDEGDAAERRTWRVVEARVAAP